MSLKGYKIAVIYECGYENNQKKKKKENSVVKVRGPALIGSYGGVETWSTVCTNYI